MMKTPLQTSFEANGSTLMGKSNASGYDGRIVWISCQAALSFMTVILIYICVCLVWFVKSGRNPSRTFTIEKCCNSKIHENNRHSQGVIYLSMASRRLRLRSIMRFTCLFAATVTLLKFLVDQVKFFHAWNAGSDEVCEIIYDVTDIAMFYFSYMGIYSFLWLKQWLFYCDPVAAKFLYSRRLVVFSRIFVVVVFVVSLGVAAANWIQTRYKSSITSTTGSTELWTNFSSIGCVAIYDMSDPSVQWPLLTYTVLNAVFQVTLLSLFIYPLAWDKLQRRKKTEKVFGRQRTLEVSVHSAKSSPIPKPKDIDVDDSKSDSIIIGRRHLSYAGQTLSERAARSIRRTIFWTTVCIVTDATLVAIFAKISIGTPQVLIAVATDFDLLVNIICILATYSGWKKILFPMCTTNKIPRDSSAHCTSSDATYVSRKFRD